MNKEFCFLSKNNYRTKKIDRYMASPHLIPMIYEFIISIFCLLLAVTIGKKYIERKNIIIKYLFMFAILLTMAILIAAISRILRLTGLWNLPSGKTLELLSITVSFIGFANACLLAFIFEIFRNGAWKGKNKIILIIYIVLAVLDAIYSISFGIFVEDLTQTIWALIILLSAPVYILLIKFAFELSKKLKEKLPKASMHAIGLGGISILLIFVFFFLDNMFISIGWTPYTIFYYIAWGFAIISILCLDIGVIQPEWFKKRYSI